MAASSPKTTDVDGVDLMRVGQLAERSGKTSRAIRFYEELELLLPTRRSKGGFRMYGPNALVRIHWIDRLQEMGFSLSEIRDFLSMLREEEAAPAAMEQLRGFYAAKLIEASASIARLRNLERELRDSLSYLHACQSCAPATPRSACVVCDDDSHEAGSTPVMVAAVQNATVDSH